MAAIQLPSRGARWRPAWGIIAVVAAGLVLLVAVGGLALSAMSRGATQVSLPGVAAAADTVTIDATGQLAAAPNVATVSIGVRVQHQGSVRDALAGASTSATRLIDTLKAQGVDPKDIQTSYVSVDAEWNYTELAGYAASNMLTVKLRDVGKVGSVISAAGDAVGNGLVVQGISFNHEPSAEEARQARQLAVQDAAAKAAQYASMTGRKVGKVLAISDDYVSFTPFTQGGGGIGGGVPVESGQGAVVARVKVTYALES